MHMKLEDLPPRMQAQAIMIMSREDARKKASLEKAVKGKETGADFDSRGEYEYYTGTIIPKMRTGEIVKCEKHPAFQLFPCGEYRGLKLGAIRYTADFGLEYADGTVEIVEVKSRFVRRMQRDYPLRRRIFIEQYARPNGWKFTEIITRDSREDVHEWKKRKEHKK